MGTGGSHEKYEHQILGNQDILRGMIRGTNLVEHVPLACASLATSRAVRRQSQAVWPGRADWPAWAEGVRSRVDELGNWGLGDIRAALNHPSRVRWLLAVDPDTKWLCRLLYDAALKNNFAVVRTLVLDSPSRAPRGEFLKAIVNVAVSPGNFEMALFLMDHGYQMDKRMILRDLTEAVETQMLYQAQVDALPTLLRRVLDAAPLPADMHSLEAQQAPKYFIPGRAAPTRPRCLRRIGVKIAPLIPPRVMAAELGAHQMALWLIGCGATWEMMRRNRDDFVQAWRGVCAFAVSLYGPLDPDNGAS